MKIRHYFANLPLYLFIIVLFQVGSRLFVYSHLLNHITLYCGDSAAYFMLATTGKALANRPSGFPWLLRLLFFFFPHYNPSVVILLFNSFLGTLAHVLFFLTLRRFSEAGSLIPFCLSMLFFMNPTILVIDSMVFMSDTFAYFLVSLVLWVTLDKVSEGKSLYKNILVSLILGYLTIVRNVFVYLSPFVVFYMLYRTKRETAFKTTLTGILLFTIFSTIPLSYAFFFNKPRLGIASIENFGGRSALSNILPYLSCEKILSISQSREEEDAVKRFCDDEEIKSSSPDALRWNESSTMNMMESVLVSHYAETHGIHSYNFQQERAMGNRFLMKWFLRSIWKYPESAVLAMKDAIIGGYISDPLKGNALVLQPPHLGRGCDRLVSRLFFLDPNTYMKMWEQNKINNYEVLNLIGRLEFFIATATHILVLLTFCLLPICFIRRKSFNAESFFLYVISLIYLILFSLGNGYDARFSVIFNYCIFLSLGILVLTYSDNKRKGSFLKINS